MKLIIRLLTFILAMLMLLSSALADIPENYVMRNGSRDEKKIAITVDDCWKVEYHPAAPTRGRSGCPPHSG